MAHGRVKTNLQLFLPAARHIRLKGGRIELFHLQENLSLLKSLAEERQSGPSADVAALDNFIRHARRLTVDIM